MSSKPDPNGTNQSTSSKGFQLPALDFSFASLTEGTDIPPPEPSPKMRDEAPRTPSGEDLNGKGTNGSGNGSLALPNGKSSRPHISLPTSPTSSTSGTTKLSGEGDHLTSPTTASSRNGSIRRMLSRHKLRSPYINGEETISENGGAVSSAHQLQQQHQQQTTTTSPRPLSSNRPPSSNNNVEVKKSRRVSGWFGKLLGGGDKSSTTRNRRASMMAPLSSPSTPEPVPVRPLTENKPKGPPPPKIPELSELKSMDHKEGSGLLGDDLFKDIK